MKKILLSFTAIAMLISTSQALVLENLIRENKLETTLSGKRIGFYPGSFDPIHKGHEKTATLPILEDLCDYVLIYPAWRGDDYKNRSDISTRLDMIFSVFQNHPQVIVTRLSPLELQTALTRPSTRLSNQGKPLVDMSISNTKVIGILGSDAAIDYNQHPEKLKVIITGIQISDKYKEHTLGGLMALPADSFIVIKRERDDVTCLNGQIGNRPVLAVLSTPDHIATSSTKIKKYLQVGKEINNLVSPTVMKIIEDKKLYS